MNRFFQHKTKIILLSVLILFLYFRSIGCNNDSKADTIVNPSIDTIPTPTGWTLVWHDEFDGPKVDTSKWSYEVNGDGGGNNELQYYTSSTKNSYIENGCLVIKALKENYLGKNYTSARMRTKYKGDWTYGRFEIKAKLPFGKGMWPAIWMLPSDWIYGGWPTSGEIDIMELLGHETNKIYGTIHYGPAYPNNQHSGGNYTLPYGTFVNTFHTFILEWDSTGMKWYVDNNLYHTEMKGKPFDKRFHILLNLAVGGNWPGNPDEFTTFPQTMTVDFVRVFQKKK